MVQGLRLLLSNPDLAKDASAVLQGGAPSERLVAALRGMQSLATTATDSSSSGAAAPREQDESTTAAAAPADKQQQEEEEISAVAFKAEVEAMVRASTGGKNPTAGARPLGAIAKAAHTLTSEAGAATKVDASLPLADFLGRLDLLQHLPAFEEDAIDLPTLGMVQRRQGSAALHEALRELGVSSKGHRLRIAAALA